MIFFRDVVALSICLVVLGSVVNVCGTSIRSFGHGNYEGFRGWQPQLSSNTKLASRSAESELVSYYGQVTEFELSYGQCTFSVNYSPQVTSLDFSILCEILKTVNLRRVPVQLQINATGLDYDSDKYELAFASLKFLEGDAPDYFASAKNGQSYSYLLAGRIRDVLIFQSHHSCYISVETGFDVEYNSAFHHTYTENKCQLAVNAFIDGSPVAMFAESNSVMNYVQSISLLQCLKN